MGEITHTDVTTALKFFVEHTGVFSVDDEGYVHPKGSDKVIQINAGSETKDLMVYQEVIRDPNVAVLNPFAEGLGMTEDQDWLYKSMSVAFVHKVTTACKFIVQTVLNQNDKKNKIDLPTDLTKFISPFMAMCDAKTIKEIDQITANPVNFMSVFYQPKQKKAAFRCAIFEGPSFREEFNLRQKTWKFMEKAMGTLFGLDLRKSHKDILGNFTFKTKVLGYPRLDAKFNLYLKLYEVTNGVFELMEEAPDELFAHGYFSVDITEFSQHLSNLNEFFQLTKHFVQPTAKAETAAAPVASPISSKTTESGMPLPMQNRRLFSTGPGTQAEGTSTMPMPHQMVPAAGSMPMPSYSGMPSPQPVNLMPAHGYQPYGGVPVGSGYQPAPNQPVVVGYTQKVVSRPVQLFG